MDATYLGTLESAAPVAIHGESQQVAAVYVGKLRLDQHVRLYHIDNLTSFTKFSGSCEAHLAFSPDGKYLVATETQPGNAVIGNWKIRGHLGSIEKGSSIPFRAEMNYAGGVQGSVLVTFSPDGAFIALSSQAIKELVYIVDVASIYTHFAFGEKASTGFNTLLKLETSSSSFETMALKWSPAGEFIAQVGRDNNSTRLLFWKWTPGNSATASVTHYGTLALPETLQRGEHSPARHLAFTPDSTLLAIAGNKNVPLRLIDVKELKIASESSYDGTPITALTFSPGGKYLISGDTAGMFCVWELGTHPSGIRLNLLDKTRLSGSILECSIARQGAFALVATKRDQGHVDISRIRLPSDPGEVSSGSVQVPTAEMIDSPVIEQASVNPLPGAPLSEAVVAPSIRTSAAQFAPCPKCGSTDVKKVRYTLTGGVIAPLLFHLVKCNNCGKTYNGKTGR